ncbi:MAG: KTSC domain-containing protein [Sphingomicrobium sp.]
MAPRSNFRRGNQGLEWSRSGWFGAAIGAAHAQLDSSLNRFVATDESIWAECRCGDMAWSPKLPTSSVIRGAWYLAERQMLDLLFTSGRRYIYSNVPMAVASGFAAAESKGRFYNSEIRNRFACREVERDELAERKAA